MAKVPFNFWIGLSDIALEGNWVWVNGEPAKSSEIIWDLETGQPNSDYSEEDCVFVLGWDWVSPKAFTAYDSFCEVKLPYHGLCEISWLSFLQKQANKK